MMLRISWTEHTTNEKVYLRVGESRSFLRTMKTIRDFLIGYILRHGSLLSIIIEKAIEGTNYMGRPLLDYINQIIRNMGYGSHKIDQ